VALSETTGPGSIARAEFERGVETVTSDQLGMWKEGIRVRDCCALMYTSGTTAMPKAAMLSHEGLVRVAQDSAATRLLITASDRVWTPLPLFHIGGIIFSLATWAGGATLVHAGQFNPAVAVDQLAENHCTVALPAFETIWLPVVQQPAFAAADLSSMRLILCVGVPERLRQIRAAVPHAAYVSTFAATEASAFVSMNRPEDNEEQRAITGGHPLSGNEVKVLDPESGLALGPDQLGELVYRGPGLFDGYYGDPGLTASVIDEQGWFHSGDMGTVDSDGRVQFVSRLKDMLKVGGENVAAAEIEELLLTHPSVLIAQVVAAPDARYIEVPAAYVQLKPDAATNEEEIIAFCLGDIATYKVPRYVRFVDAWPMSGTKIQKFVLREQIAKELADGGISEAPKLRSEPKD
jgi:fatty-acyl-CoA synthase